MELFRGRCGGSSARQVSETTQKVIKHQQNVAIDYTILRPLQFNYLSYELQSLEMSHFGIKKKLKNVGFFIILIFFRVC